MSLEKLTSDALALPIVDRIALAQALWKSIDSGIAESDERQILNEVLLRDEELNEKQIVPRSHGDVMKSAKQALE